MEPLDHPSVEPDRPLAGILRQCERGDHRAGLCAFVGVGRERSVSGIDLRGVDQALAVETERASLRTFVRHAIEIVERVAHPIRSEEHTSELQSLMRISYAVFCLKKQNTNKTQITNHIISGNTIITLIN